MKNGLYRIVGIVAMSAMASSLCYADDASRKVTLSAVGGLYIPGGAEALKTGVLGGLKVGTTVTDFFSIEGDISYAIAKKGDSTANVYLVSLQTLYPFRVGRSLEPFVTLGVGGTFSSQGDNGPVVNAGLGANYFFLDNLAIRGDVRDVIAMRSTGNNFECTVGISYRFGVARKEEEELLPLEEKTGGEAKVPAPPAAPAKAWPSAPQQAPAKAWPTTLVPAPAPAWPSPAQQPPVQVWPPPAQQPPVPAWPPPAQQPPVQAWPPPAQQPPAKAKPSAPPPAEAEKPRPGIIPREVNLSAVGGVYIPTGDESLKTGVLGGLKIDTPVTDFFGIEGDVSYVSAKKGDSTANIYLVSLQTLYPFLVQRNLTPFATIGAGGIFSRPGNNDFTLNFGLGAKYFISDNLAIRSDIRDVIPLRTTDSNIEFTLGLSYRFGPAASAAVAPIPAGGEKAAPAASVPVEAGKPAPAPAAPAAVTPAAPAAAPAVKEKAAPPAPEAPPEVEKAAPVQPQVPALTAPAPAPAESEKAAPAAPVAPAEAGKEESTAPAAPPVPTPSAPEAVPAIEEKAAPSAPEAPLEDEKAAPVAPEN